MKIMKKFIALFAILTLTVQLVACSKYTSSYSALMLARSNTKSSCSASFQRLDGSLVFKIEKADAQEGELSYTASLDEGTLSVYYDIYGTKELLFSITGGERAQGSGGYVETGKKFYVIIEAAAAKGSVSVEA